MSDSKNDRYIRWTAFLLILLGGVYVGLIALGIVTQDPETGFFRDQVKVMMEIATMISAMLLLLFAMLIRNMLEPDRRLLAEISVLFMGIMAALTSTVHFISITVSSVILNANPQFIPLLSLDWPSVLLSVDILAWDVFFGIGFVFLGLSLRPIHRFKLTGGFMISSGVLSLLGLIALPLDNMNIRYIGVAGYTIMPVISCALFLHVSRKDKLSLNVKDG